MGASASASTTHTDAGAGAGAGANRASISGASRATVTPTASSVRVGEGDGLTDVDASPIVLTVQILRHAADGGSGTSVRDVIEIEMQPTQTVADVKAHVQQATGIAAHTQSIYGWPSTTHTPHDSTLLHALSLPRRGHVVVVQTTRASGTNALDDGRGVGGAGAGAWSSGSGSRVHADADGATNTNRNMNVDTSVNISIGTDDGDDDVSSDSFEDFDGASSFSELDESESDDYGNADNDNGGDGHGARRRGRMDGHEWGSFRTTAAMRRWGRRCSWRHSRSSMVWTTPSFTMCGNGGQRPPIGACSPAQACEAACGIGKANQQQRAFGPTPS